MEKLTEMEWNHIHLARTVLVSARGGARVGALQPEGLRAFRGGLGEVLPSVQALHDLLHVVVAALHHLTLQRELLLHVLHHRKRFFFFFVFFFKPLPTLRARVKNGRLRRQQKAAIIGRWRVSQRFYNRPQAPRSVSSDPPLTTPPSLPPCLPPMARVPSPSQVPESGATRLAEETLTTEFNSKQVCTAVMSYSPSFISGLNQSGIRCDCRDPGGGWRLLLNLGE